MCCERGILSHLFQNKSDVFLYLYIRNLETWCLILVHNIHLYLCGQVENTKWILCIGVNYAYTDVQIQIYIDKL